MSKWKEYNEGLSEFKLRSCTPSVPSVSSASATIFLPPPDPLAPSKALDKNCPPLDLVTPS